MVEWECLTKPREASGLSSEAVHFGSWDVANGLVNSQLVYAAVFLTLGALAAGRILGIDRLVEAHRIVRERPILKYLLG